MLTLTGKIIKAFSQKTTFLTNIGTAPEANLITRRNSITGPYFQRDNGQREFFQRDNSQWKPPERSSRQMEL